MPFSQTVSLKQPRGRRSKPGTGTSPLQIKVFMVWTPNTIKGNQDTEHSAGYKVLVILLKSCRILASVSLPSISRCGCFVGGLAGYSLEITQNEYLQRYISVCVHIYITYRLWRDNFDSLLGSTKSFNRTPSNKTWNSSISRHEKSLYVAFGVSPFLQWPLHGGV